MIGMVPVLSQYVPVSPVSLSFPIKLDRSNYLIWNEQLLCVIFAYGVEDFIDGTKEILEKFVPRTAKTSSEYSLWSCINGIIRSWIYGSVSFEVFGYLTGSKTAYELWKVYEDVFSSSAQSRVMELKFQLQTVMREDLFVDDYVMKLKTLADNLGAIGDTVSCKDLILYAIVKTQSLL